ARARCLGFLAGAAAVSRPRSSATSPIPAGTGIWCRQEMACSGKPCRQSANLTPAPCSSTSKRSPMGSTDSFCISVMQHIYLIGQYRGAGIDLLINGDRNDGETSELFRLGCHAPLCLTADAERPPAEEIMSIGGAHGARRGTGPTYLVPVHKH